MHLGKDLSQHKAYERKVRLIYASEAHKHRPAPDCDHFCKLLVPDSCRKSCSTIFWVAHRSCQTCKKRCSIYVSAMQPSFKRIRRKQASFVTTCLVYDNNMFVRHPVHVQATMPRCRQGLQDTLQFAAALHGVVRDNLHLLCMMRCIWNIGVCDSA